LQAGQFAWTRLSAEEIAEEFAELLKDFPQPQPPQDRELLQALPDGFSIEVSPAAKQWWREAALALHSGKLVAIDYGLTADELLMPGRKEGTLRAYHRHRPGSDVLARPGEQDVTAHVNFTAIQAAGESVGLSTEGFETQAQFLTRIAARTWQKEASFAEWSPERTRQFQTLTHPEHLGRSFRVLVQSRGAAVAESREA
jgi:SAM-dependent MidA family methyltransferase